MQNSNSKVIEEIQAKVKKHGSRISQLEQVNPRIEKLENVDKQILQSIKDTQQQTKQNQQAIKTVMESVSTKEDNDRLKRDIKELQRCVTEEVVKKDHLAEVLKPIKEKIEKNDKRSFSILCWVVMVFLTVLFGIPGSLYFGLDEYNELREKHETIISDKVADNERRHKDDIASIGLKVQKVVSSVDKLSSIVLDEKIKLLLDLQKANKKGK